MAIVLRFPVPVIAGRFTAPFQQELWDIAASLPGHPPVAFDTDVDGTEFCCVGDALTLCWDARGRLVMLDTCLGLVERGPFRKLDDVRRVIEAWFASDEPDAGDHRFRRPGATT